MFTPNVIPNKHCKSPIERETTKKKLGCAFCISLEFKIKRKFTFFRQIPNIFHLVRRKISAFSLVKNTVFFTTLDEIYLAFHSKK